MNSLLRFLLFLVVLSGAVTGIYFWQQMAREQSEHPHLAPALVADPNVPDPSDAHPLHAFVGTDDPQPASTPVPPTISTKTPGLSAIDREIRDVVARAMPSVVTIDAAPERRGQVPIHPVFGNVNPAVPSQTGSGVVVDEAGLIITNRHVVQGANEIRVTLNDGRTFASTLVGSDPNSDIAVLKVDASGLTPAPFADSDNIEVGQLVFAIGNPFGLRATVTQGIVSAKGRRNDQSELTNEFIQTDADINPGNSGGPLVNATGEVVGINNHIFSKTGASVGIGFAIPSNVVHRVYDDLVNLGRVQRPFLGIAWEPMSPALANQLRLQEPVGLLVTGVVGGSAAEAAGIKPGDVIWRLANRPVRDFIDFRNTLQQQEVGDEVAVRVLREGTPVDLTVAMAERPEHPASYAIPVRPPGKRGVLDGIVLLELNPAVKRELRLPDGLEGVVVGDFQEGSPASGRLLPGDVLMQVGSTPVRSIDEARSLRTSLSINTPYSSVVVRAGRKLVINLDPRA